MPKCKFSTAFPSKNTNVDSHLWTRRALQKPEIPAEKFQHTAGAKAETNKQTKSKILHTGDDERDSFTLTVLTPSPKMAQLRDKTHHWTRTVTRNQPVIPPMGRVRVCK